MKLHTLRMRANEKGFTLIELMIVIAIIGILAAIAIPNFISYRDKAFCSSAESDAQNIAASMADYFSIPANTSIGKVDAGTDTIKFGSSAASYKLSGQNTVEITPDGNQYRIVVTEASKRCPQEYRKADKTGRWSQGDGNTAATYSLTM